MRTASVTMLASHATLAAAVLGLAWSHVHAQPSWCALLADSERMRCCALTRRVNSSGVAVQQFVTTSPKLFEPYKNEDVHGGPPLIHVPGHLSGLGRDYFLGIFHFFKVRPRRWVRGVCCSTLFPHTTNPCRLDPALQDSQEGVWTAAQGAAHSDSDGEAQCKHAQHTRVCRAC